MKNKLFGTLALALLATVVLGQDSTAVDPGGEVSFSLYEKISTGINAVLALVTTFLGFKVSSLKSKAEGGLVTVQSKYEKAMSLLSKAVTALSDDKLSPEEIDGLVKAYKELRG